MSVTAIRNEAGCVEVHWSLPELLFSMPVPSSVVVSVASSDNAAGREWMVVVVRNSSTTELQLNLDQSQLVGTPLVTVRRCCVTKSELGEERWRVTWVRSSAEDDACRGGGALIWLRMMRMSLGQRSTSQPELTFGVEVHRETYRKAAVTWSYPSDHQEPDKWRVSMEKISRRKLDFSPMELFQFVDAFSPMELFQFVDAEVRRVEFDVTLQAGDSYRVTVTALSQCSTQPHVVYRCIGAGQAEFKAELTLGDLTTLRDRAEMYSRGDTLCRVLYRNKSPEYFLNVFHRDNGIMKVTRKDNSGDPASPINDQIDGLFFMAEVQWGSVTGEPQPNSPFGSTRLIVPIDIMLDVAPKLYFADFYCMHGKCHYVTLVMTKQGSVADEFCRQHLLLLSVDDQTNNPFLFRQTSMLLRAGTREMRVAQGVKVEVLYTEDINVNEFRRRGATIVENVPTVGKGSSTRGGLPKNRQCHVCNLHDPFEPPSESF